MRTFFSPSSPRVRTPSGRQRGRRTEGHGAPWVRFGLRKEGCEHNRTALALSKVRFYGHARVVALCLVLSVSTLF